jgi:hypothetical protein
MKRIEHSENKKIRPAFRLVLAIPLIFLAAGCGLTARQKSAVSGFSQATAAMSDEMMTGFVKTRNDVISLRRQMLQLHSGSVKLNSPALDLDGPLDVSELDRRLRAAAVLGQYAQLLSALVEDTQTPRIKAASDQLLSSLRQIDGVHLSDAKADAIGSLILKIGGLLVEAERKKAARQVIVDTRQPLETVAKLVDQDFDREKLFWVGALVQTHVAITNTLAKQMQELMVDEPISDNDTNLVWTEASIAIQQDRFNSLLVDSQTKLAETVELCKKMHETLVQFRKTNEEMYSLIQVPDFEPGNLENYVLEVQELVRLGRILADKERK